MKTIELCRLAVKQNGLALYYVPIEMKTAELCLIATQQNGLALNHVPPEIKTTEILELSRYSLIKKRQWNIQSLELLEQFINDYLNL